MNIIIEAAIFAEAAHRGQTRKYSGEPYINHPMRVAGRLTMKGAGEENIAAAWLHDVVEDTDVSMQDIYNYFGAHIAEIVQGMTNTTVLADGNRQVRHQMDRDRLASEKLEVRVIKLEDRLDNVKDMFHKNCPGGFRKKYFAETRLLVGALKGTHEELEEEILEVTNV
jgi:(p)ppGpp synthase/HD superfamily hydrolase